MGFSQGIIHARVLDGDFAGKDLTIEKVLSDRDGLLVPTTPAPPTTQP
jgi:hypothetical protein